MAKRQKIQTRLTVAEQQKQASNLISTNPIYPQSEFVTPSSINKIYAPDEEGSLVNGIQAYFKSLRDTTEAYMQALADPSKLSAKGRKTFRRYSIS